MSKQTICLIKHKEQKVKDYLENCCNELEFNCDLDSYSTFYLQDEGLTIFVRHYENYNNPKYIPFYYKSVKILVAEED